MKKLSLGELRDSKEPKAAIEAGDAYEEMGMPFGLTTKSPEDKTTYAYKIRVAANYGVEYQIQYILGIIFEFKVLRNLDTDQIARVLEIAPKKVKKFESMLTAFTAQQARKIDFNEYVAETSKVLSMYRTEGFKSLRALDSVPGVNSVVAKSKMLRTLVDIEESRRRLLESSGLFSNNTLSNKKKVSKEEELADAFKNMATTIINAAHDVGYKSMKETSVEAELVGDDGF